MKVAGLLAATALIAAAAGCGSTQPPPSAGAPAGSPVASAGPSADPNASAGPSGSPSPVNEFTVDGIGPYQIGAKLADLQAAGHLADVKTGSETCAQNTTARGTARWTDVHLSARPDGKVYLVLNRSMNIPTPSGAWVGNTVAALQSIYGTLGEELTQGTAKAYLVTTLSGRGMLFDLDAGLKVTAMIAADAAYLKNAYLSGTDFC